MSSRAVLLVATVLLAFHPDSMRAALPELLADASLDTSQAPGSKPEDLVSLGEVVVFTALDDAGIERLYRTDGTPAGTYALGPACGEDAGDDVWARLGRSGSRLLYAFACPASGTEVWSTDGTTAGTIRLRAHDSGIDPRLPSASWSGRVAFAGSRLADGRADRLQVWTSNGTVGGTRLIVDVALPAPSRVAALSASTTHLFAWVDPSPEAEVDLWSSDGSGAGTMRIAELPGNPGVGTPSRPVAVSLGPRLFFRAGGREVWGSDGSADGTEPLVVLPPSLLLVDDSLGSDAGHGFFQVRDESWEEIEIWETDATRSGTRQLTHLREQGELVWARRVVALGTRRLFLAAGYDYVHPVALDVRDGSVTALSDGVCLPVAVWQGCSDLWLQRFAGRAIFPLQGDAGGAIVWSDGTPAGTVVFARLYADGVGAETSSPTVLAGDLYLGERGLWRIRSDGVATQVARDLRIAIADGGSLALAFASERLTFPAKDPLRGWEPFSTDGTATGGKLLRDLRLDAASSNVGRGVERDGELFVPVTGGIVRSRGTPETTAPAFLALDLGSEVEETEVRLWNLGERLLLEDRVYGEAIGLDPATQAIETLTPPYGANFEVATAGDGEADLVRRSAFDDCELWTTDGTLEGTQWRVTFPRSGFDDYQRLGDRRLLSFFDPQPEGIWSWSPGDAEPVALFVGQPYEFNYEALVASSSLAFYERNCCYGAPISLLATDGTPAGSRAVATLEYGSSFVAAGALGERALFLVLRGGAPGRRIELWSSDGTVAGTRGLRAFPVGDVALARLGFVPLADRLAFIGTSPSGEPELWASDGTIAGTDFLDPLVADGAATRPFALATAGDRVFVFGSSSGEGAYPEVLRLWSSPNERHAAARLAEWPDLRPLEGEVPVRFATLGGRIAFDRIDADRGRELWTSDGTEGGTRRVADLNPGPLSSFPRDLQVSGGRFFFSADDGVHGRELWAWDPGTDEICHADERHLCLEDGRFRLEAYWTDFAGGQGDATAVPLTGDSGAFWFFGPDNVELVAKVLDGTFTNGHFWVFYGALSNVRYSLTVRDGESGESRRYVNSAGNYASVGDVAAFLSFVSPPPRLSILEGVAPVAVAEVEGDGSGPCVPTAERLCLLGGRFAVEVAWRVLAAEGAGHATPWAGGATGTFWFFDPANVELIVKVLDGRPINGHFWVYFGALSNVEYDVTIRDTLTGAVRIYHNPLGRYASVGDVGAF